MKTKICTKCGRELPATSEYFYTKRHECKECFSRIRKKYYKLNSGKIKKRVNKKYAIEHPNMGPYGGKIDMIGKKYNRMLVLADAPKRNKQLYYLCRCDCGTEKIVNGRDLRTEHTKSCGCYNLEKNKERCSGPNNPSKNKRVRKIISDKAKKRFRNPINHPMWRSDLSISDRLNSRHRNLIPKYNEWRLKVFEKSNYICQKCRHRGGVLHAHHIESFATSTLALRTEVSNGITFCKKCHRRFHHKYGTHNNNREQVEEYIRRIKCY